VSQGLLSIIVVYAKQLLSCCVRNKKESNEAIMIYFPPLSWAKEKELKNNQPTNKR